MARLINTTAMTVDGVIDVGEWYVAEGEHDDAGKDQLRNASAVLLGRKTYEGLAAYWSPLEDEWANLINPKEKYVASRTLHGPLEWNATLLEGDTTDAVSRLKAELPADLLIYGCGELARTLVAATLVDESRRNLDRKRQHGAFAQACQFAANAFDQAHAEGFVRLYGLPLRVWSAKQGGT